jgi:cytochrome oxidase Cu insertion factor (SCO1/SenC/PrrC family)
MPDEIDFGGDAMRFKTAVVVIFLFLLQVAVSFAQSGGSLGPKDGVSLPPTALDRVGVGTVAPDFTLESRDGQAITLSSYRERKNVVLVFYRGYW